MSARHEPHEAEAMLYRTLGENPDLAPVVAERVDRLENFRLEGNNLHFTLERHPHILGRQSKGVSSSGYFVVEQCYIFDMEQQRITLTEEQCTEWVADVDDLAYEDVSHLLDWGGFDPSYRNCKSEDEVRARAEHEADGIVEGLTDSVLIMPDLLFGFKNKDQLWNAFCEDFVKKWRLYYIELVIERWKEWKEDDADLS